MSLAVLQLVNRIPWPLKDGGNVAHYNLFNGLQQIGFTVTLAALNTSKHFVDISTLPTTFTNANLITSYIDNNIKPIDALFNLFTKKSYHVQRFISREFKNKLKSLLQQSTFDVVIIDGLYMMPYIELIRQYSKATVVLRQHNTEYKIWQTLAIAETNGIKKWYLQLLSNRLRHFEEQAINQVDRLIALTSADADSFKTMGCDKPIAVIPVGVELHKPFTETEIIPASVFHIGAMDWMPNVQAMHWFLQQVWPKVIAKQPTAVFYMAGKKMPDEFSVYQNNNVKIIGEVQNAQQFMADKQIMVVPLFAGSGIRIKIIEGMSMAKQIVTTTLGAEGISGQTDKHFIVADEPQQFADAICKLIANNSFATQLGIDAQHMASNNYDYIKVAQKTIEFCQSV